MKNKKVNALPRILKVPPDFFSTEMDWQRNMLSQNVIFEDGKSLKTVLKIQPDKISVVLKPAASKNLIVEYD